MKEENDLKKEVTKKTNGRGRPRSVNSEASKTTTKETKKTTTKEKSESEKKQTNKGTAKSTTNKTSASKTSNEYSKKKSTNVAKTKTSLDTKSKVKDNSTKTTSKSKNPSKTNAKKTTTKVESKNKKKEETIDIAFIDSDDEDTLDMEIEDLPDTEVDSEETIEISNEKLLIDQKALEEKQLSAIKDVIKKNKKEKKSKAKKQDKYKKILKNILIAMVEILYFLILIVGKAAVPTIEYVIALQIFTIAEMIISIIIFELSYKKDKDELFLHGVEMMIIASATLVYLHFFSMQSNILNIIGAIIIGLIAIYYLIKSFIIALKKK